MDYVLEIIAAVASFGVMAAVFYQDRRNSYSRNTLALGWFLFGIESLLCALVSQAGRTDEIFFWLRLQFLVMAWLPGCWLLFSLTYARGEAADFVRQLRVYILAFFVVPVGLVLLAWHGLLVEEITSNAAYPRWLPLGRPGVALHMLFIAGCVFCLMNLERTLRASIGTMRWRIKYMIVGLGIVFVVRCYSSSQAILYSVVNLDMVVLNACALLPGCALLFISMNRGALQAVDLYPSHRVLYGSLTLVIAAAYLLLVGAFAEAATRLGVAAWFPLHAFVVLASLLGLAAILLSDRLRQRIKRFVSRHFRREQYDYRRIWSLFSEQAGATTDPSVFCRAVTRLIADTLETLSVTIWLVAEDGQRLTLGGSSSLTETSALQRAGADIRLPAEAQRLLRQPTEPVLVRDIPGDLGAVIRRLGQKEFANGGDSCCLALSSHDEVLGLLLLGDRVGGVPFTVEERELLKTIGNHLTARLQSFRLSGHLANARRLEAFQTMSAFFVHDLKNTASTLSLMLQNLPNHFNDPEFRQDALKAISRSAEKLNRVIARLTCFRQNLEIQLHAADLTALASKTVAGLHGMLPNPVICEWGSVSPVMADEEQMQNVITNLLLNAREASAPDAPIRVRTEQKEGWICLVVTDAGCGMSEEFMAEALFQPFQTTKPQGTGIGLFQSKTIVEAHGGRIEVESRSNEGSTFRVCLPPQKERV